MACIMAIQSICFTIKASLMIFLNFDLIVVGVE